jgi:hypothetical protein
VFTVTKAYRQPDTNVRLNQNKIIYVKAAFLGYFYALAIAFSVLIFEDGLPR